MKFALIACIFIAALCTMTMALSVQNLQTAITTLPKIQLTQTEEDPIITDPITDLQIDIIDGDFYYFKDSNTTTEDLPLFIYDADCQLSWINPETALEGDTIVVTFVWCEDDTSCDASVLYVAATHVLPANPSPGTPWNSTAIFQVPTLSFSKFISSKVSIELTHKREDFADLSTYVSQHKYPSDIASKTTKGVLTVVVVFCVVAVLLALAVIGYFIVKKVKKMRRQRHFPAKDHNFYRNK